MMSDSMAEEKDGVVSLASVLEVLRTMTLLIKATVMAIDTASVAREMAALPLDRD